MMNDRVISLQAAIDTIKNMRERCDTNDINDYFDLLIEAFNVLPSAQPDLIAKIQFGINSTNANDSYSCGMRNGMRWCMSLVDDKEPLFENCQSASPEIIRCKACRWNDGVAYCEMHFRDVKGDDFCSWAEKENR